MEPRRAERREPAARPPPGRRRRSVSCAKSPWRAARPVPPRRSIAGSSSNVATSPAPPSRVSVLHATTLACSHEARGHATPRPAGRSRTPVADDWRTPDTDALVDAILRLDDRDEARAGSCATCAPWASSTTWRQRWAVVRLLDEGLHYAEISKRTGASTATITRIASWLNHGEGGYREMLDRLKAAAGAIEPTRTATSDEGAPPARRSPTRAACSTPRWTCSTTPGSCSRSTTGASSRASRTTRSTSCSCARTTSSSSWPTASPRRASPAATSSPRAASTLPILSRLGYGRCRLAAAVAADAPYEAHRRPRRRPHRDLAPQRHPPVLRATRASRWR